MSEHLVKDQGEPPESVRLAVLSQYGDAVSSPESEVPTEEDLGVSEEVPAGAAARIPVARRPEKIKLRINGVELGIPCREVVVQEGCIGCLLSDELDCSFPHTDDAVLEYKGRSYPVMYAGQRVKFEEIPWQVIQFIRPVGTAEPGLD